MGYTFVGDIEEIRSQKSMYTNTAYVLCPHCYELMYTFWNGSPCSKIPDRIKKLFEKCSCCGNKVTYTHGYNNENYEVTFSKYKRNFEIHETMLNRAYKELFKRREGAEKKAVNDSTSKFINSRMAKFKLEDMPKDNDFAKKIVQNPDLIIKYLKFVLETEVKIRFALEYRKHLKLQKWRSDIETKRFVAKLQRNGDNALKDLEATYAETVQKIKNTCTEELAAILAAFDLAPPEKHLEIVLNDADIPPKPKKSYYVKGKAPVPPEKPEYKKPGLFNRKKTERENHNLAEEYRQRQAKYEEELQRYSRAVQEYEKAIEERNADIERRKLEIDATNKRLEEEYKQKLEEYQAQKAQYEEACIQKNAEELERRLEACEKDFLVRQANQMNNSELAQKDLHIGAEGQMLEDEIKAVEKHLDMLIKGRNTLLAYNIIFPKYRRVSILYILLEYLDSGRCTTLTGADGAYNLYEAEIRADQMIAQLSEITDILTAISEQIESLYDEMCETRKQTEMLNRSLTKAVEEMQIANANLVALREDVNALHATEQESLGTLKETRSLTDDLVQETSKVSRKMDKVVKNTAVTAHYSAVTAYYSKQTAEMTDALGFMLALK